MAAARNDCNPVLSQDRVADLFSSFERYGYAMFAQQRAIYRQIAERVAWPVILEAGCGVGLGTAMIAQAMGQAGGIIGTDLLERNVEFARQIYPWMEWGKWNIEMPWAGPSVDCVIAVEVIEHVEHPVAAVQNLVDAASHEVWITTPNGRGRPRPPDNPYHVREYAPDEMMAMIGGRFKTFILSWDTFCELPVDTDVSPLVYRVIK